MSDRAPHPVASSGAPSGFAPWTRRTGAWIGIGTGPGAMMVGAGVASQVGTSIAVPSVVVGSIVVYLLSVAHGLEALRTRAPMGTSVTRIFGTGGCSALFTMAMVVAMIGWCGFYLGLAGAALSDLLSVHQVVGSMAVGGICLVLAFLGQNTWNALVYLTAGSAVALTIFTVSAIPTSPPAELAARSWPEGLVTGLGGIVAYAIVFTMRTPDFTVDLEKRRDVWLAGLTMLVPLLVLTGVGVWLYDQTGLFNMADVLRLTEQPQAGQLFLVASAIAPAVTVLYSSAISLESIRKVPHRTALVAAGAAAYALGATRFDLRLVAFLQTLGAIVPSALAVMLVHPRLDPRPSRIKSLGAWVMGSALALAVRPIEPLWGFVVGASATACALWIVSFEEGRSYALGRRG